MVMATLSRWLFGFAGLMLMVTALTLIAYGALGILRGNERLDLAVLDAIGYIVISIAVFDVAKYLIEEEVVRPREMREAGETRQRLTRFIATIFIAIMLEAIVTIFKTTRSDVSQLVYPALLIATAVLLLVGLGAYQRLSAVVEHVADERPKPPASHGEG